MTVLTGNFLRPLLCCNIQELGNFQITIIPLFLKIVLIFRGTHATYSVPLVLGQGSLSDWAGPIRAHFKVLFCFVF